MTKPARININEFDYNLPEERIAKYPVAKRDSSKLLVYEAGLIKEHLFEDASKLLNTGDQLFFNNTRVVQARLEFRKETGARIEIFCLEPVIPSDYQLAYSSTDPVDFLCLVGNAKKWKSGKLNTSLGEISLSASIVDRRDDKFVIRFSWNSKSLSFGEILEQIGSTPIPPYLKRKAEKDDARNYQTVYAEKDGSVAAPTAGLHFTEAVLSKIRDKGIPMHELALHVGAGTFIPVKTEDARNHVMHSERVHISLTILRALLTSQRNIAVGTTSTRSLESLYWIGEMIIQGKDLDLDRLMLDQWAAYDLPGKAAREEVLSALISKMEKEGREELSFYTQIMIVPGYSYKIVDGLFTNYHQPKSTLLLLISALVGDDWRKIYDYAMKHNFRFLSYGDSSLLLPGK